MWTRSLLKQNAKLALRRNYWKTVLVCLVYGTLAGTFTDLFANLETYFGIDLYGLLIPQALWSQIDKMSDMHFFFLVCIISFLFIIFLIGPMTVGLVRYMLQSRVDDTPFSTLFSSFNGDYPHITCVMALRELKILLWTLCLIIPGIIKSYQYFLVPYLLAENPTMTSARASELSRLMMQDEKLNVFVLQLSFIGWYALSFLLLSFPDVFLSPYFEATFAELYSALRAKAFALGYTDENELPGFTTKRF